MTLYLPDNCGWGNAVLLTADAYASVDNLRVYKSIMKYEESGAIDWQKFQITTDKKEPRFNSRLVINPWVRANKHSNVKDVVRPSEKMQKFIEKYTHGCKWGIHIRRGAFSKDSENIGCHGLDENGNIKKAFFANDKALEKFKKIIEVKDGKFFVASDSKEVKTTLKQMFPDKVVILENNPVLTYECEFTKNNVSKDDQFQTFLEWFLLAQCQTIFITGGNKDMTDLSTFGYSAACHGDSDIQFVTNF